MKTVLITAFDPNEPDKQITEFDMEVDDCFTAEDIEPHAQRETAYLTGVHFAIVKIQAV